MHRAVSRRKCMWKTALLHGHYRGEFSPSVLLFVSVYLLPTCDLGCLTVVSAVSLRRNTSVDESYEWDSADAGADSEVPEAAGFDPSRGARARPGCDQAEGLRDRQRKGEQHPPPSSYSPPCRCMCL